MKKIEPKIKQGIFDLTLVAREGDVAIYAQKSKFGSIRWEVVKIRKLKESFFPSGKKREAGEYYPSPSEWGDRAWTFTTREDAFKKMDDLLRLRKGSI